MLVNYYSKLIVLRTVVEFKGCFYCKSSVFSFFLYLVTYNPSTHEPVKKKRRKRATEKFHQ